MRAWLVGLLMIIATSLDAQQRVVVVDRGPGSSGRVLESILAKPHRVVEPDTSWFRLRRGEVAGVSLVILDRTAAIDGTVNGDVIVVGGDLFLRPGSRVTGRAIAIGGGVYPSALASVAGGTESHRDNTFTVTRAADGYRLEYASTYAYESPPVLFPGVYGLRIPTYDRVNGASIPFGPSLALAGGRIELDALATYRSDLGKIDPSVVASARLTRRLRAEGFAGRGTFTNDAWIWSNLVNSFSVFTSGDDTRNHYRADRAEVTLHRLYEWTRVQVEPFVGGLLEDAWSVGPAVGELRGPWSVFGRTDTLAMYRPNPAIEDGQVASAVAGTRILYEATDLRARARTRAEANFVAPSDQRFTQVTTDFDIGFPTFGEHQYALDIHWVTTFGNTPPPQRFAYLGGSGTLPFLELLEQGGDELLLVDQRYSIPVPIVRLGLLGEPTILLRHRIGSAGLGRLPAFEQVVGLGVMLALVRFELQVDPVDGKARFSAGFSFSR